MCSLLPVNVKIAVGEHSAAHWANADSFFLQSHFFYYLCHKFVNHSVATSWAVVHGNIVHQLRLLIDEVLG